MCPFSATTQRLCFVLLPAVLLLPGDLLGTEDHELQAAYEHSYGLILERQWEEAEQAFEQLLKRLDQAEDAPRAMVYADDASFWRCYTIAKKDEPERAFECYARFVEGEPGSNWVNDARAAMIRLAQQLAENGKREYVARIEDMENGDGEEILLTALYALGTLGDDSVVEAIRDLYERSSRPKVNQRILKVLSRMGSSEAGVLIAEIATRDPDYETRRTAAEALGVAGREEGVPILEKVAFEDDVLDVQLAAVHALPRIPGEGSGDVVIKVIQEHPVGEVQRAAIPALTSMKDPRAREILLELITVE